jgi:hypothetical protein
VDSLELKSQALVRGFPDAGVILWCDVQHQLMTVFDPEPVASFRVSTSSLGLGQATGSHQTPAGWHEVIERIGVDLPAGTAFRNREPTGAILPATEWSCGAEEAITSRILWLSGLEDGVNRGGPVDTHARFIYIHGTNQEALLGRPASRGCIRMGNRDVIGLFDRIGARIAWCWIG